MTRRSGHTPATLIDAVHSGPWGWALHIFLEVGRESALAWYTVTAPLGELNSSSNNVAPAHMRKCH